MNMTEKAATSFVAVVAFSAVLFNSTIADSMKPAPSATVVATASAPQSSVDSPRASRPLNATETPQEQLNDLQYN